MLLKLLWLSKVLFSLLLSSSLSNSHSTYPPKKTEEFAIEIPDEDADKITTVGEGSFPFLTIFWILVADYRGLRLKQLSNISPNLLKLIKLSRPSTSTSR